MTNMKSFSDIAREITQGVNPLCTVKDAAGVMRVHEQTFYSYMNDHTEPNYTKLINLSHWLIKNHGYWMLALQFVLPCNGRANGRVDDDLMKLYEAATDAHRAFRDGDKTAYTNAVQRMKAEIKDLEKEGEALL